MFQSTWEWIGNKICMIFIFKVICIFKGIIHYVETVCAALHLNRLCMTKIQSQTTWFITLCFQSRKNVCRHANHSCYMKHMKDCRPSGHLELRLQCLMRIDQRLMKERLVLCYYLSVCLCPGCVSVTDSPVEFHAVFLTAPEEEGWHIHLYDYVSFHIF